MAQEMGRCGRGRTNDTGTVTDTFYLILSCDDFIYLNKRLFQPRPLVPCYIAPIVNIVEETQMQQNNFLLMLKMCALKGK